jgi:hypothetical protein
LTKNRLLPGDDIYEQVAPGIRLWDIVLSCSNLTGCGKKHSQAEASITKPENLCGPQRFFGVAISDQLLVSLQPSPRGER